MFNSSGGNIVGKASCEYLCLSASSWTSISGPTLNPLDVTRTAGGSSGGSVVLVCFCRTSEKYLGFSYFENINK